MIILLRGLIVSAIFFLIWQFIAVVFNLPAYILPQPIQVLKSLHHHGVFILQQSIPTMVEAVFGFILSFLFGSISALVLIYFRHIRLWFLPILLASQALPTFAIAPLLVIWFGFGMASKIATVIFMLFFPITSAFYDGMQRIPKGYLDMAQTMNATKMKVLTYVRIPMALPSLGSGLRFAATFAPMGAVISEWFGASRGLGLLIRDANSRMQIDLMFASLIVLAIFALIFYFLIDLLMKFIISWDSEKND